MASLRGLFIFTVYSTILDFDYDYLQQPIGTYESQSVKSVKPQVVLF